MNGRYVCHSFSETQYPCGSVQFSSVTHSCPTLCNPMNRNTPGLPVHQTPGVHSDSHPSSPWCHPAISSSVVPFSSCPQSLPASKSFPMSQLFAWGGQSLSDYNSLILSYISSTHIVSLNEKQYWFLVIRETANISIPEKGKKKGLHGFTERMYLFYFFPF